MKFQLLIGSAKGGSHWESYNDERIKTLYEAKAWGVEIVASWNATLRPHEVTRTLLVVCETQGELK